MGCWGWPLGGRRCAWTRQEMGPSSSASCITLLSPPAPLLEPWYWLPDAPNRGPRSGQPGLHWEPDSVPTGQGSRQRLPARQGPHWWQLLPQVSWEASWEVTSCLKGKRSSPWSQSFPVPPQQACSACFLRLQGT